MADKLDELLATEPKQVSPFSWAQQYVAQNNTQNALMQQFQQQIMQNRMQNQAQDQRQQRQLSTQGDLEMRLLQQREAGQDRRLNKTLESKNGEIDTDAEGGIVMPVEVYTKMPPSGQRKYDHIQTIQRNGKSFVVVRPKKSAVGRTSNDDALVK